jgi:glutathione S-transferase
MLLLIGDKNLSSWSLRPWLALTQFEIPFEEKLIYLGNFSIADAMYAPVGNRFVTYAVPVDEPELAMYIKTIRELPSHQKWIQAGLNES